jgi:hypothetical protein
MVELTKGERKKQKWRVYYKINNILPEGTGVVSMQLEFEERSLNNP